MGLWEFDVTARALRGSVCVLYVRDRVIVRANVRDLERFAGHSILIFPCLIVLQSK
jgi:hypothetical protein